MPDRKGPDESATKFPIETKCVGNDQNIWEIMQTSSGIHKWKLSERDPSDSTRKKYKSNCNNEYLNGKVWKRKRKTRKSTRCKSTTKRSRKSTTKHVRRPSQLVIKSNVPDIPLNKNLKGKIYITHDNGGRPFLVEHDNHRVAIYMKSKQFNNLDSEEQDTLMNKNMKQLYTDKIKEYTNVTKFFIGRDYSGYNMHGNSVLFELPGNRYVHVGIEVYEFTTDGPVEAYHSYMGNNDVPYPVTLTKDFAYFMLDHVYVPRSEFPKGINWNDAYSAFYGHDYWPADPEAKKKKGKLYIPPKEPKLTKKRFPHMKLIKKRDW